MNFYTCTLIGLISLLLKPSQVFADSFQFSDNNCYQLNGTDWKPLKLCKRSHLVYSLSQSPSLFCSYTPKNKETLLGISKKIRYYRSLKESVFIDASSGQALNTDSSLPKKIIFSKRDLLTSSSYDCTPINKKTSLKSSSYLLHKPNSFYVLKSGLNEFSNSKLRSQKNRHMPGVKKKYLQKDKISKSGFENFSFVNSFLIKPRLFYEKIEGKQITNSTSASLSGKLSPGLNLKYTRGEHANWQYGGSADLDFHIFDERAGGFLLNNNTVQTLAINVFSNISLNKRISALVMFSLYEDLYYARTSASSLGLEKELVPRITLATEFNLFRRNGFGFKVTPKVFYDFKAGPLSDGWGYSAPLAFEFIRNDQIWSLGAEYFSLNKNLSDLNLERSALSFFVETKVFF